MQTIKIKACRVETVFLIVFAISFLSGCAAMKDYCKDAPNPSTCSVKLSLASLACHSEAKRKTPVVKTATGNYICNGTASQNGNLQQYHVNSTCRPEYEEKQDAAVIDTHFRACMQVKFDDGRFMR